MPTVERRREPRVAVQLPLRFTFAGKTIDARIVDLSNSGIRFHTPQPLPVLSRMQMTLQLPEPGRPAPITIVGVVVRCAEVRGRGKRPFDAAIFFEDVSPASGRTRLQRFVGERLTPA
jgi:PilZ domain-containing protein